MANNCKPFTVIVSTGWFTKATAAIEKAGGSIQGDAEAGQFSVPVPALGVVAGKYVEVGPNEREVTITQKPFLRSCAVIETFARNQLGGN